MGTEAGETGRVGLVEDLGPWLKMPLSVSDSPAAGNSAPLHSILLMVGAATFPFHCLICTLTTTNDTESSESLLYPTVDSAQIPSPSSLGRWKDKGPSSSQKHLANVAVQRKGFFLSAGVFAVFRLSDIRDVIQG